MQSSQLATARIGVTLALALAACDSDCPAAATTSDTGNSSTSMSDTETGDSATSGDGDGDGDGEGDGDGDGEGEGEGDGESDEGRTVFVTSSTYAADLGLAGADGACQQAAAALTGTPATATYKAWLSASDQPAVDRLEHWDGRYVRADGSQVAADWDNFVDGALDVRINVVETGEQVQGVVLVWTGTNTDANLVNGDGCSDMCMIEDGGGCGDGVVDPGEDCDDANAINGDGCMSNCMAPPCGDGSRMACAPTTRSRPTRSCPSIVSTSRACRWSARASSPRIR